MKSLVVAGWISLAAFAGYMAGYTKSHIDEFRLISLEIAVERCDTAEMEAEKALAAAKEAFWNAKWCPK